MRPVLLLWSCLCVIKHSTSVQVSRQLPGSYELINRVLGELTLPINTSNVDPIEVNALGILSATAVLAEEATCQQLGLDDVIITGGFTGTKQTIDGVQYDGYDVGISLQNVRLRCSVGLCVETSLGTKDCGGTITVISTTESASSVTLGTRILSQDFNSKPPTRALTVEKPCDQIVNLQGVRFEGNNIVRVAGIDLSGLIIAALNGPFKGTAVDPIAEAVCEVLGNLTEGLNAFAVDNPITRPASYGLDTGVSFQDYAKEMQDMALMDVPPDVNLLNLRNNPLTNLVMGEEAEENTFELDLDGILGSVNGDAMNNDIIAFIQQLFQTTGDTITIDLVPMLKQLLGQVTEGVRNDGPGFTYAMEMEGIGSFEISIPSLIFSATPPPDGDGKLLVEFIGGQTLALPDLSLGDFRLQGSVGLSMDVSTTLMEQLIAFQLDESFTVDFTWGGFFAQVGALLAVDMNQVQQLQLGPLVKNVLDCALSTFYGSSPSVSAAVLASSGITLSLAGFQDGIGNLAGDLVNTLIVPYRAGIPTFLANTLTNVSFVQEDLTCPQVQPTQTKLSSPYDFSQGLVRNISDIVNPEALEGILGGLGETDDQGVTNLVDEPIPLFNLDLPVPEGSDRLGQSLEFILVKVIAVNALPPAVEELKLFSATPSEPQLLYSGIDIANSSSPLSLSVEFFLNSYVTQTEQQKEQDAPKDYLQENHVVVSVGFENFKAVLELLATLSVYDVEAMTVREVLNVDCWLGRLDPYGGVQEVSVALKGFVLGLQCKKCENEVLSEWSQRLAQPGAVADIAAILDGLFNRLERALTEPFAKEIWEQSVQEAKARCDAALEPEQISASQGSAFVFAGLFATSLSATGVCFMCCRLGRLPRKEQSSLEHVHSAYMPRGKSVSPQYGGGSVPMAKSIPVHSSQLSDVSLFSNPLVPSWAKFGVPLILFINTIMFVLGHTGDVLAAGISGSVAGVPIDIEELGSFSVVSTTFKLWEGGAKLLAGLMFLLSILWPYAKIIGMLACWFLPARFLSFKRRDNVITLLDQLGKWSLVELFFVSFVFVLLSVRVTSPQDVSFLPTQTTAYDFKLVLIPKLSLFTFTTALLLSLVTGNVVFVFQKRVKHQITMSESGHMQGAMQKVSILSLNYPVHDKQGNLVLQLAVTKLGQRAVVGFAAFAILLTLVSGAIPVLEIETQGLVRLLKEFSGESATDDFSLYSFILATFTDVDMGKLTFGIVFVVTVLVFPLIQMTYLGLLATKDFTLEEALTYQERNNLLCAWCATEVFVLAALLSVIELASATRFLGAEQCAALEPVMETLLTLDLVSQADVQAACFGLMARLEIGSYFFFFSLLISNILHICVTKVFKTFVELRKDPDLLQNLGRPSGAAKGRLYVLLARLNFIQLSGNDGTRIMSMAQYQDYTLRASSRPQTGFTSSYSSSPSPFPSAFPATPSSSYPSSRRMPPL